MLRLILDAVTDLIINALLYSLPCRKILIDFECDTLSYIFHANYQSSLAFGSAFLSNAACKKSTQKHKKHKSIQKVLFKMYFISTSPLYGTG